MIGLGSQYLTAAGFGRYRITAASLGNLDLLGTFQSPYSKAATEALKAAYPNLWNTLKQFGFDNPDKVPFINQYPLTAPYLLVDGLAFMVDCDYECTTESWKDIIGNNIFNVTGGTVTKSADNAPIFNASGYYYNSEPLSFLCAGNTIEVVYVLDAFTQPFLFSNDITAGMILKIYSTDRYFINHSSMQGYKCNAQTGQLMRVSLNTDRAYENEQSIAKYGNDWYGLGTGVSIGARTTGSEKMKGKIYAIRIYNRLLTEQEILANQAIDLQRWQTP